MILQSFSLWVKKQQQNRQLGKEPTSGPELGWARGDYGETIAELLEWKSQAEATQKGSYHFANNDAPPCHIVR